MKPYFCAVLFAVSLLTSVAVHAQSENKLVYVIPIKGEIERGLVYVIRRGITEAIDRKANAVIFDMDTPGGRVDSTEEIMQIIDGINVPVITFVNDSAISAGAIISLATDEIYMKPGSTIGDAMPILLGSKELPPDRKEKMVSYVSAKIRAAAQKKGHNVELAEAMVRIEKEFKMDKEIICPAGELLTLTSYEAEKVYGKDKKPLLSKGSVENLEELLKRINLEGAEVITLEVTSAEKIARWIDATAVSGILLALGLLAIYLEFKTPGFGIFGISGIILLAVWFWGHNVAGLAGAEEVAIFIIGVLLLALELFVIPGFGIAGISGITLIVISLILAMVENPPGGGTWHPPVMHLEKAMTTLGMALTICAVSVAILARFLPSTKLFQRLMLLSSIPREDGYQAGSSQDSLVGATGAAVTDLRPAGIATINGKRHQVVSRGEFINAGSSIIVAQTTGNRIVVDQLAQEKQS